MKILLLSLLPLVAHGAGIVLSSPSDYQVIQRKAADRGELTVSGSLSELQGTLDLEVRTLRAGSASAWQALAKAVEGPSFTGKIELPAGGWYRIEVRAIHDGQPLAGAAIDHVGIGELFVVAGQSNSANHGEEKQLARTGQVVSFDGRHWQPANDPQPGASGAGGSFIPPLGDALATHFKVPVGFIPCGIGATSVREWLPKGATFPNPPTLTDRVEQLPDGRWASKGEAFAMLVNRMKQAGPGGFRAVLWHQGESDANQADSTRTLAGDLYREYLETIIRESRAQSAIDAPWFVAQTSYHIPGDESSPDLRSGQAALWKDGAALEGPDTDALKGEFREAGGKGVHFSGEGLREHAALWEKKLTPWLEQRLK
ncbi:sialate O-acetylesterase [Luteolibacter luteus]|uniref:Sialate O-acetylesterase n=1 Tax=Luteolibacter luteus TaxID=2728835 RepID=A0A858RJV1_9BACT|nr:sialate O-acetylesterase [Luteolibacter luteus]QJE96679.1 sialate O-acetylesterase [Luteolibacter luteus]